MLNKKIENIVNKCRTQKGLNIYFVPVADSFSGHEAGTSDPYINYVEWLHSNDIDQSSFPPVSAYSIHPNEKGAEAYADAVQNKINELENNGIISGIIYEERPDTPVNDISSRIEKITAVNYDTGYKKSVYVNKAQNMTFGNESVNDDEGWSQLENADLFYYSEDQICSTGHYEMVLPPGNYQLEVSCCDGSQFTLMDANDTEQAAVVEVEARDVIKKQNIYLTEQEFGEPGSSYTWALEPSIEADDIYVVDTDEAYLDQACIDKVCVGFAMEGNYNVYDSAVYRIGGTVGLIDYSGNILETNEKHNMFTVQNGTIDVGYFWESGWPGDPMRYYVYDESTGKITDEWNAPYNGTDTILVGKHDNQWNWKYGLYKNGMPLTSIDFENGKMNYASNNDVFSLCKNGKWGYFDKDGNPIIDFVCDPIDYVPDGMLGLCITGYGTDETGTDISEADFIYEYNDIYMASDGYIPVRMDGQWALYDVSGTQVIPTDVFAEIRPVHNGKAWVKDKATGLWGVIQLEQSEDKTPNSGFDNSDNEETIKTKLFNTTNKVPTKYYYDTFEKDGTYGIIAIYQYDSIYSERDNCQVWYSNGQLIKKLFEFENSGYYMYCNVLDSFIYNDASGRPYVFLSTWQRVAMSNNYGRIFGLSDNGTIDMIFEVSGDISVEGEKIFVHEYYPQPLGLIVPESSNYEISIVDGAVIKNGSEDLKDEYVKENTDSNPDN